MEQRKRLGGNSGAGYYTSWEKSKDNGCIYCGSVATTREHIPSKAFLIEPYPENLATIPACFECNNGYSEDEKYLSCFLDVLRSQVYADYHQQEQTIVRLEKDEKLHKTLKEQIEKKDVKVYYNPDEERMLRILFKLARCHAGFEFDHINFDDVKAKIWYEFAFNISDEVMLGFNEIPEMDKAPEVGSRGVFVPFIAQNVKTGEVMALAFWNVVQDEQYRYQVYLNSEGQITVKLVIFEFLYCEVVFE
ncbi:hypothetical protein A8806_11768 [Faecalicatena orotica]|uniref:HNH endonuclease n=1 Tax=Faecalicatena orotica TaxID=1544 RepID=A0A2Y9BJF8_9FIRM|nr:hypothetical protein [Faecalicatena orotica]PWJ22728.1 hypothetical protein A8806_11768 [Faecalicatena orotica]SSA58171.1 hypothetical protein SAMN05216536_11768 [Faecalicatena orotica]